MNQLIMPREKIDLSWTRIGFALFAVIWVIINIVLIIYEWTSDWFRITLVSDALSLSRPSQICVPLQFPCIEYGANDRWTHCTRDAKSQLNYCGYDTSDCTYDYKTVCGIYSYDQVQAGIAPGWMRFLWRSVLAACLLYTIFTLSLIPAVVCCLQDTRFAKFYLPTVFVFLFVAVIIQAYCVFGYTAREGQIIKLLTPIDETRVLSSWLHVGWNCAMALLVLWFVQLICVAVYSAIAIRRQNEQEKRREERRAERRLHHNHHQQRIAPVKPHIARYM